MNISQTPLFKEILDGENPIPEAKLAYFRERQKGRLFDMLIRAFWEKEKKENFSKAKLARRLNKKPEQITRWFSAPSNWELDTISDLVLALFCGELNFEPRYFINMTKTISADANLHLTYKPSTSTSVRLELVSSDFEVNHFLLSKQPVVAGSTKHV